MDAVPGPEVPGIAALRGDLQPAGPQPTARLGPARPSPGRRPGEHPGRGPDRRRRRTPMLSRYWLRGRRRAGRRDGETLDIYVDRPSVREWSLVLAMLALAAIDAVWTLAHLRRGVEEANPLMAWAWTAGGALGFAVTKAAATLAALAFLLLHARFRLTRWLLPAAVAIYALLMGVHLLTELAVRGAG